MLLRCNSSLRWDMHESRQVLLFPSTLSQRAAHKLPLKAEVLWSLFCVYLIAQTLFRCWCKQYRITISDFNISQNVKKDTLDSLFSFLVFPISYLTALNIHDIFSYLWVSFITITVFNQTEICFALSFPVFLCLNREWFSYG